MENKRVYSPVNLGLKESFYDILKEISEIRPQTTFSKEQEEEFLKEAIMIFEYLKSGIDIKSSEILINNGEIPFSGLDKILVKFSEKLWKYDSKTFTFRVHETDEVKPVKIYKNLDNENKVITCKTSRPHNKTFISVLRKILVINSYPSTNVDSTTRTQLEKIIDYALKNDIILLYDATSNKESNGIENVKSIYEIENAKKVAIEFKRFSSVDNDKITCGYLVIPECLRFQTEGYKEYNLYNIKDLLQEEIQREKVSRKSLKKSFLNYACL